MKSAHYKTSAVFGISQAILEPSYIDRGDLDASIKLYLERDTHIALRGESKCGKSWLRQRTMPDAIVVQCRLDKSVNDIYVDALSQLGIKLTLENGTSKSFRGSVEAVQEIGTSILAKLGFRQSASINSSSTTKTAPVGHDINDLKYVAEIIKASTRRLVIEDFHYLSSPNRKSFAFDLKAFWDYGCFITLIGIWVENNHLLHLNPDLSGRVHELSIFWSNEDLGAVLDEGAKALNIEFEQNIRSMIVENSFQTVGILQRITLQMLDDLKVYSTADSSYIVSDETAFDTAAMTYADQLNGVYQNFAKRVTHGIRSRANSTGIYAHMLSVVMSSSISELSRGLPLQIIFEKAHAKQPRIQKGNLRTVMDKIDGLQVDEDGRGLVMTYDTNKEEVSVVDNQLFLYMKFATVHWPWENIVVEADQKLNGFDGDNDDK